MHNKHARRRHIRLGSIAAWTVSILLAVALIRGLFVGLRLMRVTGLTPSLMVRLLVDDGVTLKNTEGRTNILLLGVGGGDHDGADLTDTMMIISLSSQKESVGLISIPRDIWSDALKDRINSSYHYGEEKKEGAGLLLAKVIAEDVVGIPVHYAFLLDFSAFKDIINILGGVDVHVSKTFTDNDYPIAGKEKDACPGDPANRCVYETVHFEAGPEHMDGERALKYVRSRHAEGEEGSDFARGRRQQDVLIALKDTVMHPSRWLTIERVNALRGIIQEATDADMNLGELVTIAKKIRNINDGNIKKISFDDYLYNPPTYLYGRYVLIPKEDWNQVHEYIGTQL